MASETAKAGAMSRRAAKAMARQLFGASAKTGISVAGGDPICEIFRTREDTAQQEVLGRGMSWAEAMVDAISNHREEES
jgi:hypothetical protein